MEKPLCRVCNLRHWGTEPHRWGNESAVSKQKKVNKAVQKESSEIQIRASDRERLENTGERTGRPLSQNERNHRWREKNREKYNAYMREWRKKVT